MKIDIVRIADRGMAGRERIHLSVLVDTNLVYFAILVTKYLDSRQSIYNLPRYTYWFLEKPVKAGDQVLLYTSTGENASETRVDGKSNHFLHWGFAQPLFLTPADCAVLIEIQEWKTSAFGG